MVDLKCKRADCTHNTNCNCTINNLKINKDTDCTCYKQDNSKPISHTDEIPQPLTRNNTEVECDAQCIFNSESHCKANGITVCTECGNVCCSSYMPK